VEREANPDRSRVAIRDERAFEGVKAEMTSDLLRRGRNNFGRT